MNIIRYNMCRKLYALMWEKAHNQPKKVHYLFIVRSTQNL